MEYACYCIIIVLLSDKRGSYSTYSTMLPAKERRRNTSALCVYQLFRSGAIYGNFFEIKTIYRERFALKIIWSPTFEIAPPQLYVFFSIRRDHTDMPTLTLPMLIKNIFTYKVCHAPFPLKDTSVLF